MQNLVTTSDVFAGVVGAGYSSVYGMASPGMSAVKAAVVSSVARLVSESTMLPATALTTDTKNQIVVAVLYALDSYRTKGNPLKGAVTGVSVDLIAQEVMKLLNFTEKSLIGPTSP
jgi:hypothetical protein